MGIQMMGSQGGNQHSHLRTQNSSVSGFNLTLDEIEKQLLKKSQNPLGIGGMNLDTILSQLNTGIESEGSCSASSSCMQRQGSFSLARALSGKTVDEVWRDIQVGQRKRLGEVVKSESEEATPGEMTLEDFLVKAGLFAEATFGDVVGVDSMVKDENGEIEEIFVQQMSLSQSPSIGTTTSGMKRHSMDAVEKSERRLRRKMKNRESAARSRERKQAYLNELVSKVTHLQEQNAMLKRNKEMQNMLPYESPSKPKYQLRRTSSTGF